MYGQKRAHSPDGYEDNNFRQGPYQPQFGRGGHHGGAPFHHQNQFGGHSQFNKRHRSDNYQPQTIEDKIDQLGETGSRSSYIGILAKEIDAELASKTQDEQYIKGLTLKICKSIISFPTRVGTYATLIGLIGAKHYSVACQIIQTLHASYPAYLEAQRWNEALGIVHLLASLVNCRVITPPALLSQFEFLLESALEDNTPRARSDYYVYTVLSSLPYAALELSQNEDSKENFEKMLKTIEAYLSRRSKGHLNAVRVWLSDDSTVQMDYLDSLWIQMKNFQANNWTEVYLMRPYNEKEYNDTLTSGLITTNSPTLQIPAHSDSYVYPSPRVVFRVYEDDVVEDQKSIPGSDKIERFCVENHIRNMIDETVSDPKACARHLAHMHRSDQLPVKHLLIETILGELMTLPKPKHEELFYHALLCEFTRIFNLSKVPEEIKNNYDIVLNEAVKVLFENLDTMNVTCITRFINWFSFHLNNTEFIYPWQAWADANDKESDSPKALFVRGLLERCIRFSFHKKMDTLVESSLKKLMPPEVGVKFSPLFADNPKATELNDTIRKLIAYKADGVEICTKLNIKVDSVELPEDFVLREEKLTDQLMKVDYFTAVVLDMARKSLTHMSSAFGKFKNVFKALVQCPHGQIQLLQTTHSCLTDHPQLQTILVDKFLKSELIEAKEICNWISCDAMRPYHRESYPWEILKNAISRLAQNVENLKAEKNKPKRSNEPKPNKVNDGSGTPTAGDDDGENGANGAEDVDMQTEDNAEVQKQRAIREEQEKLDGQIELARKVFEEYLMQVFAMFAGVLSGHISRCEKEQTSFMDSTYRWLTGRMQEIYYNYYDTTQGMTESIRKVVDSTPTIGNVIFNLNQ